MRVGHIWAAVLLLGFTVAGWSQPQTQTQPQAQTQPQTQTQPAPPSDCPPAPKQASATPPPAVSPVKPEEHGPQTPPPYQRLNVRDKFNVFLRYTYSPYTLGEVLFDSGLEQASGTFYSYGGGMEGYGKRLGASLADVEAGAFFGRFLFPVLFREDPRYLRSTNRGFLPRAGYALSRVLVTTRDSGRQSPNFSLMLSVFAAAGVTNAYYPREYRGFGDTAERAGNEYIGIAQMNLVREFWPDIVRKLRRGPKPIRKIQENRTVTKIEEMVMGPTENPCPVPGTPGDSGEKRTENSSSGQDKR